MSLLVKLSRAFQRNASPEPDRPKELDTLNKDGRLHTRYLIAGDGLACLRIGNGMTGYVKDLSYGGMAVKFHVSDPSPIQLANQLKAELQVLDRSIECSLSLVRMSPISETKTLFAGFSIHHDSADTLIFLRDLIEPLRCGQSLAPIDVSTRHERYQGIEWTCLRGDGPTDLILRFAKDSTSLVEALLTFRMSDSYCEVSYKQNTLRTGRMLGSREQQPIPGGRMASTAELDLEVLRQAICILLGTPSNCRQSSNQLLTEALKHLKIDHNKPAA